MYDDEKGNKTYCRIRVYTYIYISSTRIVHVHKKVASLCKNFS